MQLFDQSIPECMMQAAALDSNCLAMLAEVMGRTWQLDTMEYLMAGMWILLRTPANRALLSTAFDPKTVAGTRSPPPPLPSTSLPEMHLPHVPIFAMPGSLLLAC